ncbi:DNA repair protein RadA [Gulosibacter chungangensis]|uniref:DNA repair protein RadA n=1 Tax=Gulosibacter chungangensis TaxID=979746 RepID=A0A7J5B7G9_9MICO|nr:DNA repair protein RadA [Gulosibacter chungangensis]KAB1640805.1 DNA repair protein RadA [Gulosibacter chungangensis]
MPPKSKARVKSAYTCTECGYEAVKWVGRCPECQTWGTIEERGATTKGVHFQATASKPSTKARPITEATGTDAQHLPVGIGEFDRVLGGGIVPGAAILLSGEPGVGKSTLLIEVASRVAATGAKVLYISAEESVNQVRMRASRTGALQPTLYLANETDLGTVLGHIDEVEPALLILDSVQTVSSSEVDALAGQPSQVRTVASTMVRVAKERDLPTILVGHVTKDGNVAGPRLLEHLVDVVAHIEGDRQTALRLVRTLKNRFGPTDEVGCFEMEGDGMNEVPDPSALFISERDNPAIGSCVTMSLEGRRALPVEIQALVVPTTAPNPRRVVNGVDGNRVAMILAVLERRTSVPLAKLDVFVSTSGGVRVTEPAADLAIAMAITSAHRERPIKAKAVVFGEVSLVGEIRGVTSERHRVAEAARLGFTEPIGPSAGTVREAQGLALLPKDLRGK